MCALKFISARLIAIGATPMTSEIYPRGGGGVYHLPNIHSPRLLILPVIHTLHIMSETPATLAASSSSRFQAIFEAALKSYQKQTKNDLLAHPLATQFQSYDSTNAIIAILQDQVQEFDKSRSGDARLTKWLSPTINVLSAFSDTISGVVSLVHLDT